MKYAGMPFGMWMLFAGSFQKHLTAVLGYDAATARAITKKAKPRYRQIIRSLPEFEKTDLTDFVRQYTLASGGPYCTVGTKRKVSEMTPM